jgi:hypothetical protein
MLSALWFFSANERITDLPPKIVLSVRWKNAKLNRMLTSVDARRRWFGSFFLILAGGLLVWGLTFLARFLLQNPVLFVVYWFSCFALTMLSFGIALYDMSVMRRRIKEEQRSAFNRAFSDIVEEEKQALAAKNSDVAGKAS